MVMSFPIIALVAASLFLSAASAVAQIPEQEGSREVTELEEVEVTGSPLRQQARTFVASVAAPVRGRQPATWRREICVGAAGMRAEPAQSLADRVSYWGQRVGLQPGLPGCTPNIVVVATNDGKATARQLVASRPRQFNTGSDGTDQGRAALRRFQDSDRLVRWWHVSLPVNASTGAPAVRLPGQPPFVAPSVIRGPADVGGYGNSVRPSMIADGTRDDLMQVIIVLEDTALDRASFSAVSDYVAMVALAQIDPDASPSSPSILDLFDETSVRESTLSRWDRAYLSALYGYEANGRSRASTFSSISAGMEIELRGAEALPDERPDETE